MSTTRAFSAADERDTIAEIIADFRTMLRELRCVGSERLLRQGVSMSHLHVVALLEHHGEMAMSRLAELLDVSLSNATGLVDRMAERGLVERRRVADDRRVVLVGVTDRGRQVLSDLEVLGNDLLARVLGRLDDGQLGRLAAALDNLRAAVGDTVRDEPELLHHVHGHHPARTA